jgi:hypothetical protein
MKKILLVLSLSFLLILSGCKPPNIQYCNLSGPPNVRYIIEYPCSNNCSGPGNIVAGTVRADGTYRVPQNGHNCYYLQSITVFGYNYGYALSASPGSVYLPTPPGSGVITGQGFDATYGMPQVDYFDSNGFLVGSVNATFVSGDGTYLEANMPDLSNVHSGTYQVKVTNKTQAGYYLNIVGSAPMTAWGRDRPDTDGDGWYDDEDCDPYDPYRNYSCYYNCGGSHNTSPEICSSY